jgi:hypothetical protein
LIPVLAFLRVHWRPFALAGAMGLAFAFGRFSAPTRTVEKSVEHVTYRDREVKVREAAKVEVQEHVVYRDRTVIRWANGAVEQRDVERTDTGHSSAETTRQVETRVEYRDRETVKEKRVDAPKDWSVAVLAGPQVSLKPLSLGRVAFGAHVQRRVLGPISIGLWGLSTGTAGVSLGVTF